MEVSLKSRIRYFCALTSLTHSLRLSLSLGRLADELRVEQEHGISASKAAKSLHGQVHSLLCSVAFILTFIASESTVGAHLADFGQPGVNIRLRTRGGRTVKNIPNGTFARKM